MPHFGVLSFDGSGHLNPLIALSRHLVQRGHRVTFFQKAKLEHPIRRQGLEFCAIAEASELSGEDGLAQGRDRPRSGVAALRYRIHQLVAEMEVFLTETPAALLQTQVDALLIDEIALSGPTVAEMLRLPYFLISTSVPHRFGWSAPGREPVPAVL